MEALGKSLHADVLQQAGTLHDKLLRILEAMRVVIPLRERYSSVRQATESVRVNLKPCLGLEGAGGQDLKPIMVEVLGELEGR